MQSVLMFLVVEVGEMLRDRPVRFSEGAKFEVVEIQVIKQFFLFCVDYNRIDRKQKLRNTNIYQ